VERLGAAKGRRLPRFYRAAVKDIIVADLRVRPREGPALRNVGCILRTIKWRVKRYRGTGWEACATNFCKRLRF
jgi:hypothetical protein